MKESFKQLFESFVKKNKIYSGSIINATVIDITKNIVFVDAGLKSESAIPINQFLNSKGELEISVGSIIDVVLETIENGFGETILSREKAKRFYTWKALERAHETMSTIEGKISGKVKGGFTVELDGIRAFLPGSLVDIRPIRDSLYLEGKIFEFKVIKLDQKKNNVVVSRRAAIQSTSHEKENFLESLKEGVKIKGIVKNLTDYGAFIDLGGIDGLLHITDISWKRIKHPSEIINISEEITVQILKFDRETNRVSLGLKQLSEDPWKNIEKKCKEGDKVFGKVTNITDYGCFIEIEDGIEGLVHISEMDWINKNVHPSKIVKVGNIIEVMILNIDKDRRRISLGMKQCKKNPWKEFEKKYLKGDHIKGKIKSITDFGIFVGLEGNIDGLIHASDVSWNTLEEEKIINNYKKGDEIFTTILQIDSERERVSLGIKQLYEDPFNKFISSNKKGAIVSGEILRVSEKNIFIKISDEIGGYLKIESLPEDKNIRNNFLKIGNFVTVRFLNFDKKNRIISLTYLSDKENEENIGNSNKKEGNISNVMTEAFKAATKID